MGRDRAGTPSCRAIAAYWEKNRPSNGYASEGELDEYTCFACGLYHESYKTNKAKMLRHHIHPWEFSQSHDLSNLFLVCDRCHNDCPHVDNTRVFWDWYASTPHWMNQYGAAITEARTVLGVGNDELERMNSFFGAEGIRSIVKDSNPSYGHPTLKARFVMFFSIARDRMSIAA